MTRNFTEWLGTFKKSIYGYDYYVDFEKVYKNVDAIKVELNILNSLIGSRDVENEFEKLIKEYPKTLNCIPILLAIRSSEIDITDEGEEFHFNFLKMNYSVEEYKTFMRKSGLFELISKRIIGNLVDYVHGVEVGTDTNGRKNRGGSSMEALVLKYIQEAGAKEYSQMSASEIKKKWNVDLSSLVNQGKNEKVFDFVVKTHSSVFAVEVNFYGSGGSKLNETARSYKKISEDSQKIDGFTFMWITDGAGWKTAKNNLEETFDAMEHIYCIQDLENGVLKNIFNKAPPQ